MRTYNEELAINEIEKFLSSCKYKNTGFREISSQLYDKFIDNDDKHLIKLIKKLLIIYKRFHSKLLQTMIHKWQINVLKINYGIYNSNNNIFNLNDYDNELEEPQLENKPNLYLNNMKNNYKNKNNKICAKKNSKSKSKNKSDKNEGKSKNFISNSNIKKINKLSPLNTKNRDMINLNNKNKNYEDLFIELNHKKEKLNKKQDIYKDKEKNEIKNSNNKTFEEKNPNNNIEVEEHNNSLDNLIIDNNKNKQKDKIMNDNNMNENIYNDLNYNDYSSNFDYNYNSEINKSKSVDRNNFITIPSKPWVYSYYRKGNNNDDFMIKAKKKRPRMNNTERQELFNNLYNDSKKRYEKYKKLSMEKEAKFNTIYTFTPKIITNKINEKYLKNMADSKFNYNATNTSAFYNNGNNTSLITATNNNYSLLNNVRIDPNKNYKNDLGIVEEENKGESSLDFMTRLAEYEKIKKVKLEKIKNEVYLNTIGNKNINKSKKSFIKIPNNHLLNNSENYFENRQKNIEKITQNMYEEQGITFHPKTNKSFNDKIKNNIIERNKEFIKDKQEKLEKYSQIKEKECTFKPKINTLSTMAILNNSKAGLQQNSSFKTEQNSADVSKRLFDYQNKYKEKLEEKKSKYKKSYSFKPEISKNTDMILNNKKKMMEQIKENENNIINNMQEGNNYEINNNYNDHYNIMNYNNANNNINNTLLMKQKQLVQLEEISKRISELSEENVVYSDEKISSKKKNNDKNNDNTKLINEKNQIVFNDNSNSIENNNFQINPNAINNNNLNYLNNIKNNINYRNNIQMKNQNSNGNSDKILELAKNLLKEDLSLQQNSLGIHETMNYHNNRSKEGTNDLSSLMMYNNSKNSRYNNDYKISRKNNYAQEYDFDNIKGNKRIMDLNYYDNLLQ